MLLLGFYFGPFDDVLQQFVSANWLSRPDNGFHLLTYTAFAPEITLDDCYACFTLRGTDDQVYPIFPECFQVIFFHFS